MNYNKKPPAVSAAGIFRKLKPWDCARFEKDTAMQLLIDLGTPIAKQILPLLDSTDYVVTAHTILTLIYNQPYDFESIT